MGKVDGSLKVLAHSDVYLFVPTSDGRGETVGRMRLSQGWTQ